MDLMDFFDFSKEFKPVIIEGSETEEKLKKIRTNIVHKHQTKEHKGTEYAKKYQQEEERKLQGVFMNYPDPGSSNDDSLFQLEEATCTNTAANLDDFMQEELTKVYSLYDFSQKPPTTLPIAALKQKILTVVGSNLVTVIQGSTGCGKTTQVPQYILDACYESGEPCNIIVTQPRRIAAITVAKRVSEERGWELGSLVGYQVGMNMRTSPDTRITYCTTGVLLQKIISTKSIGNYTHVILDEVHERDQDTDFALLVIRRLLTYIRTFKVILMSATFNVKKFSSYFSFTLRGNREVAPVIDLDSSLPAKKFKISIYYLCELEMLGPLPDINQDEPNIPQEGYQVAIKLIKKFDQLEEQGKKTKMGAVLIFLPGIHEIEELYDQLSNTSRREKHKWWILPLHSTITTTEQETVFKLPPQGHRKIILSTNIAESSITVPDIVYVIDFCLTKELVCDQDTNFTTLKMAWASKTNCTQRAGRSGRVADGRVYRFVPRDFYDHCLLEEGVPELLRCPLSRAVLQAKMLNMGDPKSLLGLAMDPPDLSNIESTVLLLKEIGALLPTSNGRYVSDDGDITFMGKVMAKLPVDVFIAKFIILGHIFSVLDESIIIGAAMSLKSVFSSPFKEQLSAYHSKLTWADSSCSDSIAFLNAFKVWRHNKSTGFFSRSVGGGEKSWAKRYFIQISTMHEVNALITDIKMRLKRIQIEETVGQGKVIWSDVEKPFVLKIVIAGAFYPHYFVRGAQGGQVDEREAVRQLVGRNPCSTIFLQGMPSNQPGRLYTRTIKEALKECGQDMKVSFDGSSKVYVEFRNHGYKSTDDDRNLVANIPGKVCMAVYRAIKLRHVKKGVAVDMMMPQLAAERIKELGLSLKDNDWKIDTKEKSNAIFPSVSRNFMDVYVAHIVDPGHFYVYQIESNATNELQTLYEALNGEDELQKLDKPAKVGDLLIAPYADGPNKPKMYYRGRIDAIIPKRGQEPLAEVYFIDFGNISIIPVSELRDFSEKHISDGLVKLAPLAFECVLSEIKPSQFKNPRGVWSEEAFQEFSKMVLGKKLKAKIYSVVNGVISMELIKYFENAYKSFSINTKLVDMGLAEPAEESYLSKMNHDVREQQSEWTIDQKHAFDIQQEESFIQNEEPDPEPPLAQECRFKTVLKGPYSPLEMKLYNLTQAGLRRQVNIEWSSVNSVLLDTDPQDPHERVLVAASVGLNPAGDRLTLRHTTLLPNIHGLPALLCLIFSPTVELRVNESMTRYTGALCGVGYDPKSCESLFPDHDIEVVFDTEITLEDLQIINRLRYWMSISMYTEDGEDSPDAGRNGIIKCQNKVKEILFELFKTQRKPVELQITTSQFKWKQIPDNRLLSPGEMPNFERAIFPLHWAVELDENNDLKKQVGHLRDLHEIAKGTSIWNTVRCEICRMNIHGTAALKVHLQSTVHKNKELMVMQLA